MQPTMDTANNYSSQKESSPSTSAASISVGGSGRAGDIENGGRASLVYGGESKRLTRYVRQEGNKQLASLLAS